MRFRRWILVGTTTLLACCSSGCVSTILSSFKSAGNSGPRVEAAPEGKVELAAVSRAETLHVAVEFVPEPFRGSLLQRLAHEIQVFDKEHDVSGYVLDPVTARSMHSGLQKLEDDPQGALGPLAHFLPDWPGVITPKKPNPTMKRFPRVAKVHVEGAGISADTWTDTSGRARLPLGPFAAAALTKGLEDARLTVESEGQRTEVAFSLDELSTIVEWTAENGELPGYGLDEVDPRLTFWSGVLAGAPPQRLADEAKRRLATVAPALDATSVALVRGDRESARLADGAYVDWTSGPSGDARLQRELDLRREPVGDGSEIVLTVENVGRLPIHRLRARLRSGAPEVDGATLLIGRLAPGQRCVRRLVVPRADSLIEVEFHATDDARPPLPADAESY